MFSLCIHFLLSNVPLLRTPRGRPSSPPTSVPRPPPRGVKFRPRPEKLRRAPSACPSAFCWSCPARRGRAPGPPHSTRLSGAARPGLPTAAPLFILRSVLGDAPRPVPFARRSPFVFLHRPGLCLESPHLFVRSADEGPSRRTVGLPRAFPVFLSPDARTQNSAWTCLVPRERPANELSDLNAISPTAGREMASPSVAFLAGIRPVGFCAYFLPNDLDYASRERPKGHDVKEKASRGTRGEGPGCARPDPARRAGGQAGGPAGASASLGRPLVRPRLLVNARDAGARTAAAGAWRRGRRRGLWC